MKITLQEDPLHGSLVFVLRLFLVGALRVFLVDFLLTLETELGIDRNAQPRRGHETLLFHAVVDAVLRYEAPSWRMAGNAPRGEGQPRGGRWRQPLEVAPCEEEPRSFG